MISKFKEKLHNSETFCDTLVTELRASIIDYFDRTQIIVYSYYVTKLCINFMNEAYMTDTYSFNI